MKFPSLAHRPKTKGSPAKMRVALMVAGGLVVLLSLSGCGTPGTPQAPSLKLPDPVDDLTAVRNGDTVELHWTMPRRTTDRLLIASQIRGSLTVRVCRRAEPGGDCQTAGEVAFGPVAAAEFRETLPAPLASGLPRRLGYFVEVKNAKGRSAGLSNAAEVLAGAAPAGVAGLAAEVRADGVALHWTPGSKADGESAAMAVRLHRTLLTPAAPKKGTGANPMQAGPEPVERDLLVETPADGKTTLTGALDASVRFGEVYRYTAQRVERVTVKGTVLELAGEISPAMRVVVVDTFPPAVPRGLAAVFVPEDKAIDLSWEPDSEPDLAGYIVYRADAGDGAGGLTWKQISGAKPLAGPAYRDLTVVSGHGYRYAVSAIDLTGHESKRSADAGERVPDVEQNP